MYLESSARSNLPYYKKYGFEEKCDIHLVRGLKPITLQIMVREPLANSSQLDGGASNKKVGV